MLKFAVPNLDVVCAVETVVVVKMAYLAFECLRRGRFIDAPNVPTGWFGLENTFELGVVVKSHTAIILNVPFR